MSEFIKTEFISIDTNYILEFLNKMNTDIELNTNLEGKFTKTGNYTKKLFNSINNLLENLNELKKISKNYIENFKDTPKPDNYNLLSLNFDYLNATINTNNKKINILKEPNSNSEVIETLKNGSNIKVLGSENNSNYLKIKTSNNEIAYVDIDYVKLDKSSNIQTINNKVNYQNYRNYYTSHITNTNNKKNNDNIIQNNFVMQDISNKQVEQKVQNTLKNNNKKKKKKEVEDKDD